MPPRSFKVGAAIRRLRVSQNMTQERLAFLAGIAPETVSRLERSQNEPSLEMLAKLAQALGVTIGELTRGGSGKSPSAEPLLRPGEAVVLAVLQDLDDQRLNEVVRGLQLLLGRRKGRPRPPQA